jgi:nitrous oxide reductase accessory protein NosL
MKKAFTLTALAITLIIAGCDKESTKPCNCGLILSDRASDYSIVIRNECTGNEKRFYLQPGDWYNAYVGTNFCISNSGKW